MSPHRLRLGFALAIASMYLWFAGSSIARADDHTGSDEHAAHAAGEEHPGDPAHDDHAPPAPAEEHDKPEHAQPADEHTDDSDAKPTAEFDADGDGVVEPEEAALQQEFATAFKDVPNEVTDAELDKREAGKQLVPSLTAEQLRAMVKVARAKVLGRMEAKMEHKAEVRMGRIGAFIRWFSLAGILLLLMPVVLRKKYPNQGAAMFKYSALAAVTFVVTVNLFGTVVLGFRSAQSALGPVTNPQLRIASGFFDSIDRNADEYLVMGKELFAPTLEQLKGNTDEQPAAILIENGKKVVKDAQVFVTIAKTFKKLDFIFAALPIVLLLVTMILFVIAIRPTLLEIIRLPMTAASGQTGVGTQVVKRALRRVGGELLATLCTLGVLVALTFLAGTILGRVVGPALDSLIGYFQVGISYLQFVSGGSSALVFVMLFGVILFLVLNLAAVIVSMTLFLGKSQKIFQRRFNDGIPLREHVRFWKWGSVSVLVAQIVPWLYLAVAGWGLDKIDDKLMSGVTDASQVSWKAIMLTGPLFLVFGFLAVFWAARGFKAIVFLAKYKVPPAPQPSPVVVASLPSYAQRAS